MSVLKALFIALCLVFASPVFAQKAVTSGNTYDIDKESGLIIDKGWEIVEGNCAVCHGMELVTIQRADRATWLELIRWMQDGQGLWEFDPDTENEMLDYLAKHYAPVYETRKRLPLFVSEREDLR